MNILVQVLCYIMPLLFVIFYLVQTFDLIIDVVLGLVKVFFAYDIDLSKVVPCLADVIKLLMLREWICQPLDIVVRFHVKKRSHMLPILHPEFLLHKNLLRIRLGC